MRKAMITLALALLAATAAPQRAAAQGLARNMAYFELFGSGGAYSLNFERRLDRVHVRVGYGSWSSSDLFGAGEGDITTIPITLSNVRGFGNHHLETGGGLTFGNREFTSAFGEGTTSSEFVTLTGLVGYRYQKPGKGVVLRALFTPLIGFGKDDVAYPDRGFTPSVGFSLGYAF